MNLLAYSGFINAFLVFLIGVFVYFKGRKHQENRVFCFLCLSIVWWQTSYGFWQLATNVEESLFFLKLLMIGSVFSAVFLYHLTLVLLNLVEKNKKILIGAYLITFSLLSLIFSPLFILETKIFYFYPYWPIAGIGATLNMAFGFVWAIFSIFLLAKNYFRLTGERKYQIGYFLLALFIAAVGGTFNLPQWYGIELYPYGNFIIFLFPLIIAFAILRYHLFDIRIILTELLVGIMGILLLVLPLIVPTNELKILATVLFLLFCIFGYLLIKTTHEQIQKREELERAYNELKELDETKTMFLSIASHQLRTPLSAMKGYLSMVLSGDYGVKIEGQVKEFLEKVYQSNERLINLVNDLLDITRLQMGKLQLNSQPVQIEEIVQSVVDEFSEQARQKNLSFVFKKPSVPLPKINVDPQKIRQVILNLIDNAIKYTKKGGITVKVQHNSSTNSENGTILITVKDTGIGLTTKDINNLFNYLKEAILLLKLMLLVLVLVFMRPKRLLKPIEARSGQNLPAETRVLPFMLNYQ